MEEGLQIGTFRVRWLSGGAFAMDGGAMFGVVPKMLWSRTYPSDDNYIRLLSYPLLVETSDGLVVIETGIGNKLTEKQKTMFRVSEDWTVPKALEALGHSREDVGFVVLTHCDFDHAGGVLMRGEDGDKELTFPRARHVVQRTEWEDASRPNRRASHTYWEDNFDLLRGSDNLVLVEGDCELLPGLTVAHTGGHTRGHQVVRIRSQGQTAIHMADLLPTHAHFNPLWVMAFDNFPLEAIEQKSRLEAEVVGDDGWFLFYHDPFMRACKFDHKGNVVTSFPPER